MGWVAVSGWHSGQADWRSVADGADGFQCHVAGALRGLFVGLLEQGGPDETHDGGLVEEFADDIAAPLDLVIEPWDGVGGVQLGGCAAKKVQGGQHVLIDGIQEGGDLGPLRTEITCDGAPLGLHGRGVLLGVGGGDPGRDDAALYHAGMGGALPAKSTRCLRYGARSALVSVA